MTKIDYCGTIIGYQELNGDVKLGILVGKIFSPDKTNTYYRVKWFDDHNTSFDNCEDLYHENDIKQFLLPDKNAD